MLKRGHYKYCAYVGHPPQLFDVQGDPLETVDLADDPAFAEVRASLEAELCEIADPEEVNARAKADQSRRATS
jgi:choline-sulfatase